MKPGKTCQWLNPECAGTTTCSLTQNCALVSLEHFQVRLQLNSVSCLGLRCMIKLPQLNVVHVLPEPKQ